MIPPRDAIELLRARVAQTPAALEAALAASRSFAREHRENLARPTRWSVSGIGASEGVARACATDLRGVAGRSAELLSVSRWLAGDRTPVVDDAAHGFILFSQGLSPNARAALRRAPAGAVRVLFTASPEHPDALDARRDGWLVCAHPPPDEDGLLVRVTGPCCALVAARALAESIAPSSTTPIPARAAEAFREGLSEGARAGAALDPAALSRVRALLTVGDPDESLAGLAWAWMEATLTAPVAGWDVLGFAHGPFQALFDHEGTLLSFERDASEAALFDRLASMLDRARHTLVRLRTGDEDGWGLLRRHGALWGVALTLLESVPLPLASWPGKGLDGPLYDLRDRPR